MFIKLEPGEHPRFVAPLAAPYGYLLRAAGWREDVYESVYYTVHVEEVAPFVEHLEPSLREIFEQNVQDIEVSLSTEPSSEYHDLIVKTKKPDAPDLLPYQEASVEYILKRKNSLLAQDAGMGKTAIMITAANILRPRSILIICPATVKYNWMNKEWPKWANLPQLSIDVVNGNDFPDTDVIIINPDILGRHKEKLDAKVWDLLLIDESHKFKNKDAQRTKYLLGANGKTEIPPIRSLKRIFATATPMNRPKDLWTTVKACDPNGLGKDFMHFHKRYCAAVKGPMGRWDFNGADHLEELGAIMRGRFMVRHDPAVVLPQLPPLTEDIILLPPVDMVLDMEHQFVSDNLDALLNLNDLAEGNLTKESSTEEWMRLIGDTLIDKTKLIGNPAVAPIFTMFAALREATGVAKVPYVIDYIRDRSDDLSTPTVVMAYHKSVVGALRDAFPGAACVVGGMGANKRIENVDEFQFGHTNLFIGNIHAAGEGITLTRSCYLIFAEMDWQGSAIQQARKRVHRITQDKPTLVEYVVADKSFDAYVTRKAVTKIEYMRQTLDTY